MTAATTATAIDTGLTRRQAWILTLAATATMTVSYVDRQALSVLAPTITKALHLSEQGYSWLASGFSIAYLAGAPVAGRFIDGVGARRGLVASVLTWSAVAAAHALVPGFWSLFLLRVLLGMAESPSFPAAAQTVARALPPVDRNAAFGVLFTGSSFGAMAAAPLVTVLEAHYGWRWALLGTAVVGLAWVPMWLWATRTPAAKALLAVRPPTKSESDSESDSDAAADAEALSPSAAGATRRRGTWARGLRSTLGLLADAAVLRAVVVVVATAPGIAFVLLWGSKVLVAAHGLTQRQIGHYVWLPPLFFDAGAVVFGALATRRNRRLRATATVDGASRPSPVSSARLLFGVAMLLEASLATLALARTPWETTLSMGVALVGGGALFALLTADMMSRVDPARVAAAGGLTAAAQSLAYVIANPIVGAVADRTHHYGGVAAGLGLWVLPGCLVWLLWEPRGASSVSRAPASRRSEA